MSSEIDDSFCIHVHIMIQYQTIGFKMQQFEFFVHEYRYVRQKA